MPCRSALRFPLRFAAVPPPALPALRCSVSPACLLPFGSPAGAIFRRFTPHKRRRGYNSRLPPSLLILPPLLPSLCASASCCGALLRLRFRSHYDRARLLRFFAPCLPPLSVPNSFACLPAFRSSPAASPAPCFFRACLLRFPACRPLRFFVPFRFASLPAFLLRLPASVFVGRLLCLPAASACLPAVFLPASLLCRFFGVFRTIKGKGNIIYCPLSLIVRIASFSLPPAPLRAAASVAASAAAAALPFGSLRALRCRFRFAACRVFDPAAAFVCCALFLCLLPAFCFRARICRLYCYALRFASPSPAACAACRFPIA